MKRLYPGSSDSSQGSPEEARRDRKQTQQHDLVKGLGKALSSSTAEAEKATSQRHRETQLQQIYATQMRVYAAECKSVNDHNRPAMKQNREARQWSIAQNEPVGELMSFLPPPSNP
ncbi:hypothetical protein ABBQ32_013087 [Trebouxia sp. C0010 RCD-2024]